MEVTEMARLGGETIKKKLGRAHYVKMGILSGKKRREKILSDKNRHETAP
jgi:hypothetical protein